MGQVVRMTRNDDDDAPSPSSSTSVITESRLARYSKTTRLSRRTEDSELREMAGKYTGLLYLPDVRPVYAVLAAQVAHWLDGDPVWLMMVGPSGSGKTEIVMSLRNVEQVYVCGEMTSAGLLSGSSKKDRDKNSTGGLLRQIGASGTMLMKDFTSVLSMHREELAKLLGALREIYEGQWTRHIGTDGGMELRWSGKCGLVAATTNAIDRHHTVIAEMGQRMLLYRLPESTGFVTHERSLRRVDTSGIRDRLHRDVADWLVSVRTRTTVEPVTRRSDELRLLACGAVAARCRGAISRDSYSREVDNLPVYEAPMRLINQLHLMHKALMVMGAGREETWWLLEKLALDCIPESRRVVLEKLARAGQKGLEMNDVLDPRLGQTAARRVVEDLEVLGVVEKKGNVMRGAVWRLTEWAKSEVEAGWVDGVGKE